MLSFSSARWWTNLRGGEPVCLLLRGRWYDAVPTVAESVDDTAALLAEFVRRNGPQAARRLMLGLPGDRQPTDEEVQQAAAKTTIVRFHRISESN